MMSGIRGKDTQPELLVRRGLFAQGFRFRLHDKSLPGRPDIVIRKHRAVVLVHGCFWHAHRRCRFFKIPRTNQRFWKEKLEQNLQRDTRAAAALHAAGWRVAIAWECAIRESTPAVLDALSKFLRSDQPTLEIPVIR
jgi:DNA mismatch endonuclease, patch repair protein